MNRIQCETQFHPPVDEKWHVPDLENRVNDAVEATVFKRDRLRGWWLWVLQPQRQQQQVAVEFEQLLLESRLRGVRVRNRLGHSDRWANELKSHAIALSPTSTCV
jgi:hypothetical protein